MRSIEVVQQMIDWIETNMEEGPTLQKVSCAVGYSPWYCSSMFHDITGVPLEYDGEVPKGFSVREIPASDYLVFSYPVFDFMTENADVMEAVENLAFSFDPSELGYEWNEEEYQIYQRHYPEKLGYQVVRPVRTVVK